MKIAPSSCLLSVVAAICLAAGCATQHGGNTRTYVAHAMMIEGPTSEFERIGWNDVTNNMKPSFTAAISDSVFQSLKLKVVHFPLLALRLGQTTDASNQQIVRYATSLDTNGMPGVFKEQGVGQKMQIRLVEATGARVSVDAWLENVREPKWQNVTEGMNGASECKIPFFASRSWFSKMEFAVDSWCVVGGRTDDANMTVFAIKISYDNNTQPSRAPLPRTPQTGCSEVAR